MPQIAALAINDGASTPVTHTFSPVSTTGQKSEFAERSSGAPAGFLTISHEVTKPSTAAAAYRVKLGINVPVSATIDGVPTVVRNSSAQVILNLSQQSSEQERLDLLAYVANALADAGVIESVQNVEPFY